MPPWYVRAWCKLFGHQWIGASKEPVIPLFLVCERCRKFERIAKPDEV